jgi:hypothetical protein
MPSDILHLRRCQDDFFPPDGLGLGVVVGLDDFGDGRSGLPGGVRANVVCWSSF